MDVIVYVDGAARGNPGPAGIGVYIEGRSGEQLAELAEPLAPTTNNVAEYTALIRGLQKAAELGATRVQVRTDSELMARQVMGIYKVRAAHLSQLHARALALMATFDEAAIRHIPREQNRKADALSNRGADIGEGRAGRGPTALDEGPD
ncbi:MAG: ribonuclease HI family protein [Armatimonadetes bacterium]|nr:ribonuclease HI family protein [Armatimonadota bacterium]MDE2206772.1 ribonuclease HI family protein [Armatimonadota bacterium]